MSAPTTDRPRQAPAPTPGVSVSRTRNPRLRRSLPTLVQLALLALIVLCPMFFIVMGAFTDNPDRSNVFDFGNFTFDNFALLGRPSAQEAMWSSAIVGIGSSILALLIGATLAFLAARTNIPGRKLIYGIGIAPLFLPSLVGALAWALLAGPATGYLNLALTALGLPGFVDIYSFAGMIFVLGLYYAPYPFLMIHSALSLMNPDLEDAASLHGAGLTQMLRKITFPLVLPATIGSGILVFALTVENFAVAQVIGVPGGVDTLPTLIYRLMNAAPARSNDAAAIAVVLTVLLVIVVALQNRVTGSKEYTTVSGKGVRARQVPLRGWRWPAAALAWLYFVLAVALPMGALVVASLQTSPYLARFGELFDAGALSLWSLGQTVQDPDFHNVVLNSVIVGVSTAAIGTTFCFALAYTRYRTRSPGRSVLEYVAMLPLAVPAIVLGLGLLWTWLALPVPIYGTLAVLVVAFIAVFLPQGYRGVSSSIVQLDQDLEDSAVMLGASRAKAIRFVTVPLLRIGLSSTFLLLLMLSMRELTAALFLFTSDTRLLSIAIFDAYDNGSIRSAAELGLLYCVVIGVLAALSRRFGAKESK
uniref:ABC transporter permease n=1 Tax=unclassified Rhodococcus (in: high G+C Gram-positive bacteria) TaxID=192944 RepID=UPI0020CE9FC3|nr:MULTISPECIES: iron ABC transporter permease [unclassified Rhodococcus (in: high G+C Gram-positive bacteria)]